MRQPRSRRIALDLPGLMGQRDLFRLSHGLRSDPQVERWLSGEPAELRTIAHKWFSVMRHCGEDVLELMHDGCPVACVEDLPFAYVNSFKNHVNVGFFRGAMLEDPSGLLAGSGKRMRHVKIKAAAEVEDAALRKLIKVAYMDIKECL